jgi:hypothetical protein
MPKKAKSSTMLRIITALSALTAVGAKPVLGRVDPDGTRHGVLKHSITENKGMTHALEEGTIPIIPELHRGKKTGEEPAVYTKVAKDSVKVAKPLLGRFNETTGRHHGTYNPDVAKTTKDPKGYSKKPTRLGR